MQIFKSDELFGLGAIEARIKKSRYTLLYWIKEGLLISVTKAGTTHKHRLKLTAKLYGNSYMAWGADINEFLEAINKHNAA